MNKNSRTIKYVEPEEDELQTEVETALSQSIEERFKAYCDTIAALYAMANIDVTKYRVKRTIGYINE